MTTRWGTEDRRPVDLPAILEAAGHSVTALLLAILVMCALGMAVTL